jgi:hypothetical protein
MNLLKIGVLLMLWAYLTACGDGPPGNPAVNTSGATTPLGNSFKLEDSIPQRPKPGVLDLKATSVDLDRDIRGQSAPEMLDAIHRLDIAKTKYESDAVYAKRMKELNGSKLRDEVAIGSVIGFEPDQMSFNYDANKQLWKYQISPHEVGNQFHYVPIYKQAVDGGGLAQYTAAFPGKQIKVVRLILLDIAAMKGLSYINGSYKVSPKEAPALEGNLTVLLVGRVTTPYAESYRKLPIHADEHVVELQNTIGFKLEAVWLINKVDGKVLSKTWNYERLT